MLDVEKHSKSRTNTSDTAFVLSQKLSEKYTVPISVFADRTLASLEAIVEFLKENYGLSYHEIAELLHRDDRTIWTCYHRAKKKREAIAGG